MATISLVEHHSRQERITTTGMEIVSTYYVEPYSAAPIVICALLGHVTGNDKESYRVLPVADRDYPFCFCVEARRIPMDQRAIASGTSTGSGIDLDSAQNLRITLRQPAVYDGPNAMGINGTFEKNDNGSKCGAFIEAVFRPLISGYTGEFLYNSFDYIEPRFTPASRVVSGAQTLVAVGLVGLGLGWDVGEGPVITETWQDFTIRRVMCPTVPWKTIRCLQNRINRTVWHPEFFTIPGLTEDGFPAGTLRFDSATVTERVVPTCLSDLRDQTSYLKSPDPLEKDLPYTRPMRWFDIEYHFSWRTVFSSWMDAGYVYHPPDWVSWNCDYIAGGLGVTFEETGTNDNILVDFLGKLTGFKGHKYPTGWYELGSWVNEVAPGESIMAKVFRKKYLDAEAPEVAVECPGLSIYGHPFNWLFLQGAP